MLATQTVSLSAPKVHRKRKRRGPCPSPILLLIGSVLVGWTSMFLFLRSGLLENKPIQYVEPDVLWNERKLCIPPPKSRFRGSNSTQPTSPPSGIVVTLLLGGENPQLKDGMCNLFPSQLTQFIVPHQLDVLLVVSGNLDRQDIIRCLHLKQEGGQDMSEIWKNLDGSTMRTERYRVVTAIGGKPYQTTVFLAYQPNLRFPSYIEQNKSILSDPIEPPMCQAPVEYIQGTMWYANEMLHLGILKRYDYWVKLDPDVVFMRPIDWNVLQDMDIKGAVLGHAAEYPTATPAPCSAGLSDAIEMYLKSHTTCAKPVTVQNADRYYTNFLVGNTKVFQSPPILELARWLAEYPDGFYRHRWTDQIFWYIALQLAMGDAFQVADYTELRCSPISNCWTSVLELRKYPDLDICANGGLLVHTKNSVRWASKWKRHTARPPYQIFGQPHPHVSRYHHACPGSQ